MIDAENSRPMRDEMACYAVRGLSETSELMLEYHGFAGRIGVINDFRRMLFEYTKG